MLDGQERRSRTTKRGASPLNYVTRTGRSKRIGRTTRASKNVKRPSAKPLPLHLQCHPQALHRTPVHPACKTFAQPTGGLYGVLPCMDLLFRSGWGLSPIKSNVAVVVDGCGTWYARDVSFAFSWAKAARATGLTVNVYI